MALVGCFCLSGFVVGYMVMATDSLLGKQGAHMYYRNQQYRFWMVMSPGVPYMGYTYLNL